MGTNELFPSYQVANNGLILPKGFPIESYYSGLEYKAQSDDVFIISYPECGVIGYQYILYLLKNQGRHLPKRKRLDELVPQLEVAGKEAIEKLDPPRVIASNLPRSVIPYNTSAKYIYVARNPIDCCISFYNRTREFIRFYSFHEGSFDTFFELFVNGKTDFGDYFDHLLPWYQHRNDPNVLFLLCEDSDNISKIGNFLGGVFRASVESEQIRNDVERMAGAGDCLKEGENETAEEEPKCYGKKIGEWETHFNDEQIIRLSEKIREKLGPSGASELWAKYGLAIIY